MATNPEKDIPKTDFSESQLRNNIIKPAIDRILNKYYNEADGYDVFLDLLFRHNGIIVGLDY